MKKEIAKSEKFYFISNFIQSQTKFNKFKKIRKIIAISSLSLLCGIGVLSIFNYVVAFTSLIFSAMVSLPTLYYFSSKIQEIIENANYDNITYKVFKKMYKSGEIQDLIDEYYALTSPKPSTEKYQSTKKYTQKKQISGDRQLGTDTSKTSINIHNSDKQK